MNYGLQIKNPGQQVVINASGRGLYCLGKGTLISGPTQVSGLATGSNPGRRSGNSVYRVTFDPTMTPVIAAIDVRQGFRSRILGMSVVSAGQVNISAYCGNAADGDNFDTNQVAVDVWLFGFINTMPSGYGLAIYRADGSVAYDLTKPNILLPRSRLSTQFGNVTFPGVTRTVAIGNPGGFRQFDRFVSANSWSLLKQQYAWGRNDTSFLKLFYSTQQFRYNNTEPQYGNEGADDFSNGFIIEGAGLP